MVHEHDLAPPDRRPKGRRTLRVFSFCIEVTPTEKQGKVGKVVEIFNLNLKYEEWETDG